MHNQSIPLIRASSIKPVCDRIEAAGGHLDSVLVRCGLTRDAITSASVFVPAPAVYQCCEEAARVLRDPHLGARIGIEMAAGGFSALLGPVEPSSTFAEMLTRFIIDYPGYSSAAAPFMEIGRDRTTFRIKRGFTPDAPPAQADAIGAALILGLVQRSVGQRWSASDVIAEVCAPAALDIPELAGTTLATGDLLGLRVSFPTRWLVDARSPQAKPTAGSLDTLRSVLAAHLFEPGLDLERAAQLTGLRASQISRVLRDMDASFTRLLDDLRREAAVTALSESACKISDAATSLGYSNASNFCRAFIRWTGVSPRDYRARLKETDPETDVSSRPSRQVI